MSDIFELEEAMNDELTEFNIEESERVYATCRIGRISQGEKGERSRKFLRVVDTRDFYPQRQFRSGRDL